MPIDFDDFFLLLFFLLPSLKKIGVKNVVSTFHPTNGKSPKEKKRYKSSSMDLLGPPPEGEFRGSFFFKLKKKFSFWVPSGLRWRRPPDGDGGGGACGRGRGYLSLIFSFFLGSNGSKNPFKEILVGLR